MATPRPKYSRLRIRLPWPRSGRRRSEFVRWRNLSAEDRLNEAVMMSRDRLGSKIAKPTRGRAAFACDLRAKDADAGMPLARMTLSQFSPQGRSDGRAFYLVLRQAAGEWKMPPREWSQAKRSSQSRSRIGSSREYQTAPRQNSGQSPGVVLHLEEVHRGHSKSTYR